MVDGLDHVTGRVTGHGTVVVLDPGTNQIVETIKSGIQPGLMTASPDGRTIYVADVMGATVRVITSVHESTHPASPAGPLDGSSPAGDLLTMALADTATGTGPSAP